MRNKLQQNRLLDRDEVTLAVVADTHVPDHLPRVRTALIDRLRSMPIDMVLHAGDICVPAVLEDLACVAPVLAVRGNRDFLFWGNLNKRENLEWKGLRITLAHGHDGLWGYLVDKYFFLTRGYTFERYARTLLKRNPGSQVIIFGHTHFPENSWYNRVLFFNPGSAGVGVRGWLPPSFGILRLKNGSVEGEIINIPEDKTFPKNDS